MRSRAIFVSMIMMGAAACAPVAPSAGPSPDAGAPPVRSLLSERETLALSPEQVMALDSISSAADVRAASDRHRGLLKIRMGLRKQPDRALGLVAAGNPAMRAVEQLLRPEQRQRLCQIQRERQLKQTLQTAKRSTHSVASSSRRGTQRTWPWCSLPSTAVARSER